MNLTVNCRESTIIGQEEFSISELLIELNVTDPLYVTVELNGAIMERKSFDVISVKDGDEVEFLYFMGGGRE